MNYPINPAPDIPMSTSGTLRDRIQEIPEDEDFIIYVPMGGDPHVDEQD